MVSKAELILEGNAYPLNSVSMEIGQVIDKFGRPSSKAQGGKIEVELYSVDDEAIFEWMVHTRKALNGSINLYKSDNETKLKEIKFENGYCIQYTEIFDASMDESLVAKLTISAEKLSLGNIDLDNQWLK